jgi:D-glycero-alpha-D-manno-heptose-7-phosphate kinase
LPAYFERHGGAVLSATINRYFYVVLSRTVDDSIQLTSSDFRALERGQFEDTRSLSGDLTFLKSVLHEFGVTHGLSIFTACEVPPGTGLGTSSTVAVALIKALATLCQRRPSKQRIAELASYVEIVRLGRPIGLQDQFAAAFGGLNFIRFESSGTTVSPIRLPIAIREELESSLMLFYTGASRNAETILAKQRDSSAAGEPTVIESLHGIKRGALDALEAVTTGRLNILGKILHESWQRKKRLAPGISTDWLDRMYQVALEHGAVGGKIAGAGGGGFLLLYCEPKHQRAVTHALEAERLTRMTFQFDDGGAHVLVNSMQVIPGLRYPEARWVAAGSRSE